jgi:HKD family nuclease
LELDNTNGLIYNIENFALLAYNSINIRVACKLTATLYDISKMRIISNQKNQTHLTEISSHINSADEIIFCVAFLKNSGLNSVLENLKTKVNKCSFYIGVDFYLTEPLALKKLFDDGHNVYLTQKKKATYHPKIFYFRNENIINVIIGSTNLTYGGFETNIEASFAVETTLNSQIEIEFRDFIKSLNEHSTQIINEQIISDYENKYLVYKDKHSKAQDEFEIELQKIIASELERDKKLKVKRNSEAGAPIPKVNVIKIRQEDIDSFPIFLPKYIHYRENNRNTGAVHSSHGDIDLKKWYGRMKDLIKHEAIPDEMALDLIDADFPFDNAWGGIIKLNFDRRFKELLAFKEKEQKDLDFIYVIQTKIRSSPYYELGKWITISKQRRKGQHGSDWTPYEEKKMASVNYLWDISDDGTTIKDINWGDRLVELEEYYSDKNHYNTVPHQTKTKIGKWVNGQMTEKITGTRGKVKQFLHPTRVALLGAILEKNGVEWEREKQVDRDNLLIGLKGWKELEEWKMRVGNRKANSVEVKYFKPTRNWMARTRNRSKKWDREKEKWKIELLTTAGFPLPNPSEPDE